MLVYRLRSPSGHSYIGITRRGLELRWEEHVHGWRVAKRDGGRLTKLNKAMDKYPPETWTREVLATASSLEDLAAAEVEYIALYDTLRNGYNSMPGGELGWTGENFNEDHRAGIARGKKAWWDSPAGQAYKEVLRERFRKDNPSKKGNVPWNVGVPMNDKTKEKVSRASKGRKLPPRSAEWSAKISVAKKGKPLTHEHRKKIGEAGKGRARTERQKNRTRETMQKVWLVTCPDGKIVEVVNLRAWCLQHNLSSSNVSRSGQAGYVAKKKEGP